MRQIRLRPRARADLAEIRRYTQKAWGPAQARIYLEEIGTRIEGIAGGEAQSTSIVVHGRVFQRCRYKDHYIFFRETAGTVDIVRIFHAKMDILGRLAGE
jgi:toxin ParE1/3/4